MKTAIHRAFLTSVLLAFCMGCLLVALPQPAFADSHYPDPDRIFLDGMRYSEGHPAGASYNPSTGVLTLNNYNGGGIYVQHPESFEAETLTIDLKGDNVVTCINAGNDAGIDISGSGSDLIITSAGGGTLTVTREEGSTSVGAVDGIFVNRGICISGNAVVYVNVSSISSSSPYVTGISSANSNIEVKDHASLDIFVSAETAAGCYGIQTYGNDKGLMISSDKAVSIECYRNDGGVTHGLHDQHTTVPFMFSNTPKVTIKANAVWTSNSVNEKDYLVDGYSQEITGYGSDSVYVYEIPYENWGWIKVGTKWRFYMGGGAYITSSFFTDKNKTYYFGDDAFMVTGWKKIDGTWYYFESNGAMKIGWVKDGGKWYYTAMGGGMVKGWQKISGTWYYFNGSGVMQTGWQAIGGKWYWFTDSGAMVTGWAKISGKYYYFDSSGAMQKGWLKSGGSWYYLNSSGAMVTGWAKISGTWYYFFSNGKMATGTQTIGGKTYRFASNGAWLG